MKIHSFLLKYLFTNENKHPYNLSFKVSGKSVELLLTQEHEFHLGERSASQLLHSLIIPSDLCAGVKFIRTSQRFCDTEALLVTISTL